MTASALRHVDPNRPRGRFSRAYAAFGATGFGKVLSRLVFWKLDPILLRLSGGRLSAALVVETAVLETRGVKSGARRANAVIYFHDGDRVTIIASKAGAAHHPAWYHNLRAEPAVTLNGIPMRATVVTDEIERARLWKLADNVFAPFAKYRREAASANRVIPIVQLLPR